MSWNETGGGRPQVLNPKDIGAAVPLHPGEAQGLLPGLRAERVRRAEHYRLRVHVQQRSGVSLCMYVRVCFSVCGCVWVWACFHSRDERSHASYVYVRIIYEIYVLLNFAFLDYVASLSAGVK